MKAWVVTGASAPLEEVELPTPEPVGTEILIEVMHCGVCHSDVHFWHGEYNLGRGKIMKITDRGVKLPRAPGHEIAGRVVKVGPDAEGVAVGDVRVVYPWLGCGHCERCQAEEDNLCLAQRSLGVIQHGGFASHVVVPHSRYLVDPGNVDLALAATYACSGLTTYHALRKVLPLPPTAPIVLFGAGGLGLMCIAMLKALGHQTIYSVDVNASARDAAKKEGATMVFDGAAPDLIDQITKAAGGLVPATIDFVNITPTARTASDIVAKGGVHVMVGVGGGELEISNAGMVFRAMRIEGVNTGKPQDLRDVMALARAGKLPPIPVEHLHCSHANEALERLDKGGVTGRLVLDH